VSSISIRSLNAGYGTVQVLHDVSMHIDDSEIVTLLGTNGNGKSTLLGVMMGLVRPTEGQVVFEIDGRVHDAAAMSTEQIVEAGVCIVPEGRQLFPKMSVEQNLMLGAYRSSARSMVSRTLQECFELFPILKERRSQAAGSMSGGEQQMLAIGRAMMARPKILLIDEPSVGLAPIMVKRTIDKIQELKEHAKLTVLMAEQNLAQAIRIADRGYVIVSGKIEVNGENRAELENNALIQKLYLGTS
jgi:branched-chain amino acid transport system ATP-binding protein